MFIELGSFIFFFPFESFSTGSYSYLRGIVLIVADLLTLLYEGYVDFFLHLISVEETSFFVEE